MACSGSVLLVCLPSAFFFSRGVLLVLPLPSLCRCRHWWVNGVRNRTADSGAARRRVLCGYGLCPRPVRLAVHVHLWAGAPSRWVWGRLWLFRLGGCASRSFGARRVRGGGW